MRYTTKMYNSLFVFVFLLLSQLIHTQDCEALAERTFPGGFQWDAQSSDKVKVKKTEFISSSRADAWLSSSQDNMRVEKVRATPSSRLGSAMRGCTFNAISKRTPFSTLEFRILQMNSSSDASQWVIYRTRMISIAPTKNPTWKNMPIGDRSIGYRIQHRKDNAWYQVISIRGNMVVSVQSPYSREGESHFDPRPIAAAIDRYLKTEPITPTTASTLEMAIYESMPAGAKSSAKSEGLIPTQEIETGTAYILTQADGKVIPVVKQVVNKREVTTEATSIIPPEATPKSKPKGNANPSVSADKPCDSPPEIPSEVQIRATYAEISLGKDGKHRIKFLKPGKQTVKLFYLDKTGKVYAAGELKVTVQPDPDAPRQGGRKPSCRSAQVKPSEKAKTASQPKVSQ